jgi:hypothetical protein
MNPPGFFLAQVDSRLDPHAQHFVALRYGKEDHACQPKGTRNWYY